MKKTITITSRGEAQRLLVTGEVKEMFDVDGKRIGYSHDKGTVRLWSGEIVTVSAPCTYSIEVPDEAPKPRYRVHEIREQPDGEYLYEIVEGDEDPIIGCKSYRFPSDAVEAAQAECDKRNAPPTETREQLIERLAPDYEECAFGDADSEDTAPRDMAYGLWDANRDSWQFGPWVKASVGNFIWLRKKRPTRRRWGPWEECFEGEEQARDGQKKIAFLREYREAWSVEYDSQSRQGYPYIPVRLAAQPMREVSDEEIAARCRGNSEAFWLAFTSGVRWREELARKEGGK